MNTQHTPGPWRVQADPLLAKLHPLHQNRYVTTDNEMETWRSADAEGHGDDCCGFVNNEGAIICTMPDSANQAANARLIAAAPELLAACTGLLQWAEDVLRDECNGRVPTFDALSPARAAIAAATGKE